MMAPATYVARQRGGSGHLRLHSIGARRRGACSGDGEGQGEADKRGGERAHQQGLDAGFHGFLHCARSDLRQTRVTPINGARTEQFRF
jgi:hypothetical protein